LTGDEFEDNVIEWREKIKEQIKSFKTIYEIVEEMWMKNDQIYNEKKGRDVVQVGNLGRREKILCFKVEKIGFNYVDENNR
jgi:hypothetical protein